MSGNIRRRGKHYHYDFMIDGKRYKGSTKTSVLKKAISTKTLAPALKN